MKQAQSFRHKTPALAANVNAGEMSLADAVRETKRTEVKANLDIALTRAGLSQNRSYFGLILQKP